MLYYLFFNLFMYIFVFLFFLYLRIQHGTCPICRKYLADDGLSSMNADPLGISLGVGPNLAALIRFVINILILNTF